MTAGFFGGAVYSAEIQGTINWLSGEYMLSLNNGGGFRGGTPANGVGLHLGGSAHYHASQTALLEDSSLFVTVDVRADAGPAAGVAASYARAAEYSDLNRNDQFDRSDSVRLVPVVDPKFNKPVESLSIDATAGFDVTPTIVDVGVTGGIKDTNQIWNIDLYAPFRRFFE